MVEVLAAVLVAAVVVAAVRHWWRGRRSASGTDADGRDDGTVGGPPGPGSPRRSPGTPDASDLPDDRDGTEVTTDYARGVDATEEGNRIWEGAMADWEAEDYDAASDGFGWAETQYSAAVDLFERAPTGSTAVWQTDDGDDDGPRRAAESYETAARHMRLAADRAAEGDVEASTEHVEAAREALAGTGAGPADAADEPSG